MPNPAQFTLNLFGSTALDWTLDAPTGGAAQPAITDDPEPTSRPEPPAIRPSHNGPARNYQLEGDRKLARGWPARARDNIEAIRLAASLGNSGRAATQDEQARLIRFIGFGATELAQNCFPEPGTDQFRPGWEETGAALAAAVTSAEYAALARATQYAHFSPEPIIRAMWRLARQLGFTAGRVLEPGMGTGLFFALMPNDLRQTTRLTGVEYDPVTARIARLLHPEAHIRCEDYTRSRLGDGFDLAIGNPPFANRVVRGDRSTASLKLLLHDYFIARSISRLRPGGIGLFITSAGTMDKGNDTARSHIAGMADLLGAVRLPEGSMRASAGTDVIIDILAFQRREPGQPGTGEAWRQTRELPLPDGNRVEINEYFLEHPEMVLGVHGVRRNVYGPGLAYGCKPLPDAGDLESQLDAAFRRMPAAVMSPSAPLEAEETDTSSFTVGTAATGAAIKEGSFVTDKSGRLCQVIDGTAEPLPIRGGKGEQGITSTAAKVIRAFMPMRDAVREILRAQAADRPWAAAQIRLRTAYSAFIRYHGPINHTVITTIKDPETGLEKEIHRRPNIAHFIDDPDCWLVAAIESYDPDTGRARKGPIFDQRVVSPPATKLITNAADALAVTLAETGGVDPERLADLLDCEPDEAVAQLGTAIFHNPKTDRWETADAYLSGIVRDKLAAAEEAARTDSRYAVNVEALRTSLPPDVPPSAISARLGAPWLPTDVIRQFTLEVMETSSQVHHTEAIASWTVKGGFAGTAAGTSIWGTDRRDAGLLLQDALNGSTPQIFDYVTEDGQEKRIFNEEETEAAKEKQNKIKNAFTAWIWSDPERAERLSRIYNDRFNNLVPRHFDGSHLTLPGASDVIRLNPHQKRVAWRIVSAGNTYIAHAVGAGKTFAICAAIMEQKRLGLISKAMLVVPGHCLAQAACEFLQLYPGARILVADESNFAKQKRARFLARAATANWDAIIITHSAFRFIPVPAQFEREIINEQIDHYAALAETIDGEDRISRKRLEAMREKLTDRLETIKDRRDDMVTIEEIGIDQIIIDEAQEFRKLSFATNRSNLKGVDPDGSQRAWDLYVKGRFIARKNPRRALIQASGTPITNTMGEMYTLLRFQNEDAMRERGIHEFDAWAATFGDTRAELELQPSGLYKPVERFSHFVNVPELISLFRDCADVVLKDDLRQFLHLPRIHGGKRQLITAEATAAFRSYQHALAARIAAIEARQGKAQKGDDILLSVITDGRHAAIDLRLVNPVQPNEPENKLNKLIANVHRIWRETADLAYRAPDGSPYPITGAGQLIFSDLGTLSVEESRGFSAYRWIKQELIRLGVPPGEIAYMQDHKRSADKQRLFSEFNAGRVRIVIGSSDTMGTGVNAQARLIALHHLDVPWLPSHIEQREGRIERQGNQNEEISIYAYATLGSMDATMWQNNERKMRFISAALSGDRSIRTLEDLGGDAVNQFAMAKAIASGDTRLLQKAGLETEIARLLRQRDAHIDDQIAVQRRLNRAKRDHDEAKRRCLEITADLAQRISTRGDAFTMTCEGHTITDRRKGGTMLLSHLHGAKTANEHAGHIGGFDLSAVIDKRWGERETLLVIERNGGGHEFRISEDMTPLGLISRIEHHLERLEDELAEQQRRADEAARRQAGYEEIGKQPFPLQSELDGKEAELAELNRQLAQAGKEAAA